MLTNVKGFLQINGVASSPLVIGTPISFISNVYLDSVGGDMICSGREFPIPMAGDPGGFNFQFAFGDLVKIKQGRLFSNLASGLIPYFDTLVPDECISGPGYFQAKLDNRYLSVSPDTLGFPIFTLSQNIGEWSDLDIEMQMSLASGASPSFSLYFTANPHLKYKTDLIDSRLNNLNYYIGCEFLVEHSQPIIWS